MTVRISIKLNAHANTRLTMGAINSKVLSIGAEGTTMEHARATVINMLNAITVQSLSPLIISDDLASERLAAAIASITHVVTTGAFDQERALARGDFKWEVTIIPDWKPNHA